MKIHIRLLLLLSLTLPLTALAEIRSQPLAVFNDDSMEDIIEPIISRYVPDIAGGAVRSAMSMIFASDA